MNDEHTLFVQCIQHNGELLGEAMAIDIADSKTFGHLKKMIKTKMALALDRIDADCLTIYKLKEPIDEITEQFVVSDTNAERLESTAKISSKGPWPEGLVHMLAQLPALDRGASDCIDAAIYSY